MKNTFLTILVSGMLGFVSAQSVQDVGKIALSVAMPDTINGIEAAALTKLETKITQIISTSGLAAIGFNNNFVIYPKFSILESNVVEGGMQNLTVISAEVSLFIRQMDNNIVFASISKQLKGSGGNKEAAIENCISKLNAHDPQMNDFINTGKAKIINYYESKCQDIIDKADKLVKMQDFSQALGLLMSIPDEVTDCRKQLREKCIWAYKVYQNFSCSQQIQAAKATLAVNNYDSTAEILAQIDPSTPCFRTAQELMDKVSSQVNAEKKKQWDLNLKIYNDSVALERQRISSIKDIAVSYYKSLPTHVQH